jgi:hypothetical protein
MPVYQHHTALGDYGVTRSVLNVSEHLDGGLLLTLAGEGGPPIQVTIADPDTFPISRSVKVGDVVTVRGFTQTVVPTFLALDA